MLAIFIAPHLLPSSSKFNVYEVNCFFFCRRLSFESFVCGKYGFQK